MKKLITLGLIVLGATALTYTTINAASDSTPKTMKCNGGDKDKKESNTTKPAPEKGKCGTGKCG